MILGVEDIILVIDIIVIALVVLVSFYRLIKWAFIGTYITLVPEGTIQIVSGCKIQIEARIKQRPKCNFRLDWQKVGNNNEARNISFCETVKYSGTEIKSLAPVLLINKAEKDDAGLYQLRYESSTEVVISRQIAVHVFGDTTGNSISEGENNFLRYYSLCRLGRDSVLRFFRHHVKENNLQNHLNHHKQFLQRNCSKVQKDVLYPQNGWVRSTDFDFTLLYKLVRNTLVGVSPPKDGWSFEPKSGGTSKSDDIERIRSHRNFLSHTTKYVLPKLKFKTQWRALAKAINRLSDGTLKNEVQSLSQRTFYKHNQQEYIQILNDNMREIQEEVVTCRRVVSNMQDRVLNLEDNVASVQQNVLDIEERLPDHHIPPHIKRSQNEIIENWKQNNSVYIKDTHGFCQAFEMVQSRNVVVIIGGPGSGKTATARCIALQLREEEWEIIPVFKPDEIMHYRNTERQQVFLLDDFIGSFTLNMSLYDNVIQYKAPIFESNEQNTKILLTCRKSVYNAAIKLQDICCLPVIDLESNENKLNNEEKRKILKKHCDAMSVLRTNYENLSLENANIMFPILCSLFACNKEYQTIGDRFFQKPFEGLSMEFDKMQKRNTEHYASLILCMISGNKLSIHSLPETETKGCVYDSCGLNQGTSIRRIQDALEQMIGTYVTRVGDCYSLIHDSLFDILAYHYGRRVNDFPEIITYLPSNFISNRLCVDSDQADDEFSIQTPEDQFDRLAERLYRDLYDLKFYEVFRTKSLLHELFIKIFIEILENKSYESFKKVFLSFQRNVSCERPRDIDGTVHYLLTDFVFLEDKHERCCIRAISWVVYFGHLKLLKYIINRVRDKEGSCKSVFGIEKIEQTRLLVLCCYRNDENMTRLLLNNLDRDCINRNLRTINMNYNVQNSHRYYTPLIAACERGNLSIVKLLVENGAEIDTLDPQELSPLSVAYYNGHIKIVNFILNKRRPQDKKVILVFKQPVDENTERIVTCNPTEWPLITVKSQSRTQPCEKNQSSLMTKRDNQKPSQGKRYERKRRERALFRANVLRFQLQNTVVGTKTTRHRTYTLQNYGIGRMTCLIQGNRRGNNRKRKQKQPKPKQSGTKMMSFYRLLDIG